MTEYIEMPDCKARLAKEIIKLLEDDLDQCPVDTQYQREGREYLRQLKIASEEMK